MEFRARDTGVVYSLEGLQTQFPGLPIPRGQSEDFMKSFLDPMGIDVVVQQPAPADTETKDVSLGDVVQIDGVWTRVWQVVDWTQERIDEYKQSGRENVWEEIKAKRTFIEENAGVQVAGKWFESDMKSLMKYIGLKDKARDVLAAGGDMTSAIMGKQGQIQWATMDNSTIPMTVQIAFDLVTAVGDFQEQLYNNSWIHKAQLASADPATYDYSTGWPAQYQDTIVATPSV